VWWLRSYIGREQIATKDAQIDLARSQNDELATKLAEGREKIAELERKIEARANPTELYANAASAASLFGDMQIISDNMGVTLTPQSGRYQIVVPLRKIDDPKKS
jgi:epoxyqueuosine reductase QueG